MARVFQTNNQGEAHVRCAIVNTRGQADLLVHRSSTWGLAHGDGQWFIATNKQDANTYVYFGSIGQAQVKIHFVSSRGEAGWVTEGNPYQGRFR